MICIDIRKSAYAFLSRKLYVLIGFYYNSFIHVTDRQNSTSPGCLMGPNDIYLFNITLEKPHTFALADDAQN